MIPHFKFSFQISCHKMPKKRPRLLEIHVVMLVLIYHSSFSAFYIRLKKCTSLYPSGTSAMHQVKCMSYPEDWLNSFQ